jgi:hypothetical protein
MINRQERFMSFRLFGYKDEIATDDKGVVADRSVLRDAWDKYITDAAGSIYPRDAFNNSVREQGASMAELMDAIPNITETQVKGFASLIEAQKRVEKGTRWADNTARYYHR